MPEPNHEQEPRTFIDDVLDWLLARPRNMVAVLVLGIAGIGIYRPEWLFAMVPLSADQLAFYASLAQRWLAIAMITFVVFLIARAFWVMVRRQRTYTHMQILPHSGDMVRADDLIAFIRQLHGLKRKPLTRLLKGKEWFSFIIHRDADARFCFYIGAERDYLHMLRPILESTYPNMECFPDREPPFPSGKSVGGRMTLKSNNLKKALPLAAYHHDQLASLLTKMDQGNTWLQVAFSPNEGYRLRKAIEKQEKDLKAGKSVQDRSAFEHDELKGLKHRYSGNEVSFDCTVSMSTEAYPGVTTLQNMGNALSSISDNVNRLRYKRLKQSVQWFPRTFPYRMVWTGKEIVNLVHMPFLSGSSMQKLLPWVYYSEPGRETLPGHVLNDPHGLTIGALDHAFHQNRSVQIPVEAVESHFCATGNTGSGKSSMANQVMISMMLQRLQDPDAPSFSFADPQSDTAQTIFNNLLKLENDGYDVPWDQVHWYSFRDIDHPPALNLLHRFPGEDEETVVDRVMHLLKPNFGDAPQTEYLLRQCIKTLLLDQSETHTIHGASYLADQDLEAFRKDVLQRLRADIQPSRDHGNLERAGDLEEMLHFWDVDAPELMEKSKASFRTRMEMFSQNKILKRMFGQKGFDFDVRTWMEDGHLVFFDLGGLKDVSQHLVMNYLSYAYYQVAEQRSTSGSPKMHLFVMEEARGIPVGKMPDIISKSRKKGLSLGLIVQTLDMLPADLQNAMKDVQNTYFIFKQGPEGAKEAEELLQIEESAVFTRNHFKQLPKRVAVIQVSDENDDQVQCRVKAPPLDLYLKNGGRVPFRQKIPTEQAKRYTQERAQMLVARDTREGDEVIARMEAYRKRETYQPKPNVTRKPKAPVQKQPDPPKKLIQEVADESAEDRSDVETTDGPKPQRSQEAVSTTPPASAEPSTAEPVKDRDQGPVFEQLRRQRGPNQGDQ